MAPKPMVVTFPNDSWNLRNGSLMEYWGIPVFLKSMKLIQAFEITTPPPGKRSPPKKQENEAGSVLIVSVYKEAYSGVFK